VHLGVWGGAWFIGKEKKEMKGSEKRCLLKNSKRGAGRQNQERRYGLENSPFRGKN